MSAAMVCFILLYYVGHAEVRSFEEKFAKNWKIAKNVKLAAKNSLKTGFEAIFGGFGLILR